MTKFSVALHAHFYQPPRLNPVTGKIGSERSAAPYRNWNERAAEEVYRPNAKLGNFGTLSFDMGDFLLNWLYDHDELTYQQILKKTQADNLLAVPFCQAPLPTLSPHDRLVMLRWGAVLAKQRLGHTPVGVFLPLFAADEETLAIVAQAGYQFTLLRSSQVVGLDQGESGLQRLKLSNGGQIAVFIAQEELSHTLLREMMERGGAGYWSHRFLMPFMRRADDLTVLYVDGEMLGQHRMCEADFVYYLLRSEALAVGFQPVTLTRYYQTHPQLDRQVILNDPKPDNLSETQNFLSLALQNLMTAADDVFTAVKGGQGWLLAEETLAQLHRPQDPHLIAYMTLRQAWANCMGLERYPQLSIDQIFSQAAYAIHLLAPEADLTSEFAPHLAPHVRGLYAELAGQMGEKLEVVARQQV